MASSMYFEPSDSSFYAVALKDGGVLWKVSMKDTVWTEVSKPIHNDVVHQDCDFSFYSSILLHGIGLLCGYWHCWGLDMLYISGYPGIWR